MVTLNNEQATTLQGIIKAVRCNFKHYTNPSMNTGFATIHNLYPNDLRVIDEIMAEIDANVK